MLLDNVDTSVASVICGIAAMLGIGVLFSLLIGASSTCLLNIGIWMLSRLVVGALLGCHTWGGSIQVGCWNRWDVIVHCWFIVWFRLFRISLALSMLFLVLSYVCLLYTSPSPRDATLSRMPSSA